MRLKWTPGCGDLVLVRGAGSGRRPAVVLSPAAYSARTGLAVVCPVVDEGRGYPFAVDVPPGLCVGGAILADRITSLDLRRTPVRFVGPFPEDVVTAVRERVMGLVAATEVE